jgi:hypothetical protein
VLLGAAAIVGLKRTLHGANPSRQMWCRWPGRKMRSGRKYVIRRSKTTGDLDEPHPGRQSVRPRFLGLWIICYGLRSTL